MNVKCLRLYSIFFLLICFLAFFAYYRKEFGIESTDELNITNNTGYLFLSLIPIVIMWKERPGIQYSIVGIIFIMILLSFKRGAIVSGGVCILFFLYYSLKNNTIKKKKWKILILSVIILVVIYKVVLYLFETSDYFNSRYERTMLGDANGRDYMFPMFLDYLDNLVSGRRIMFGGGLDYSIHLFGLYCHNDWFELAICHGLLGVGCYLYYWFCFIKNLRMVKNNNVSFMVMTLFFCSSLLNTFYTFSINSLTVFGTSVLGYVLALNTKSTNDVIK